MANIDTYLQQILAAIYGEEVRGSIHDAIEAINDQVDAAEETMEQFVQGAMDTTLTSTTKPAQGKAVGDAVSDLKRALTSLLIKGVVDSDEWQQGTVTVGQGTNLSSQTRIRTRSYINNDIFKIGIVQGYKYCLFCYDSANDNSYVGCFNGYELVTTGSPWLVDDVDLFQFPDTYIFRIVISSTDDTNIGTDKYDKLSTYVYTDTSLSRSQKPADAKIVGDRFNTDEALLNVVNDAVSEHKNKFDADYNVRLNTGNDEPVEKSNGTRIRIIYYIFGQFSFTARCTLQKGIAVSLYDTLENACKSGGNYIKTFTNNAYTTNEVIGESSVGGYLVFSQSKTDDSAITDSERDGMFSNLEITVISPQFSSENFVTNKVLNETIQSINYEITKKSLFIGDFIQGKADSSGEIDTNDSGYNYRVTSSNVIALPYGSKRKLIVKIDNMYVVAIMTGARSTNLNHTQFWFKDGDIVTVNEGDNYYRVVIANYKTAYGSTGHKEVTITPNEDFKLSLYYEDAHDINFANDEAEKILSSARLDFNEEDPNEINKYAVIAHTSDCHGDYARVKNFLDYSSKIDVDVACITGDIVSYSPSDGIGWFNESVRNSLSKIAICPGNHDVNVDTLTDSDLYNFMYENISDKIGNATGKTWYYTDISNKKIRIISVNLYQYGGTTRWNTHFTNEQLSFICEALLSTPQGYGIIILSHTPLDSSIVRNRDIDYPDFFQNVHKYSYPGNDVNGYPLYDIVDAFIERRTISATYSQTGSPSSISVSADFSGNNVAAGVEFIAHLSGHFHADTVTYLPGRSQKQLMLNVTCTNALYGGTAYPYLCDLSDQGRNCLDSTADAFNVYVIDRENKTVKIIRIGANKTYDMMDRKYMVIPYADAT